MISAVERTKTEKEKIKNKYEDIRSGRTPIIRT
jgi:hypothetical protein